MEFLKSENKKHAAPRAGAKVDKKQKNNVENQNNKKAFALQKVVKTARMVQRTLDHQINKLHLPTDQRIAEIPPPLVVAIVGPPRSGKSTLLRSLLKHFARQTISLVTGPITVVANKNMRFTFIECMCDINQMIDIAKIADIVLLMVNCRIGLEHYHFEFINLLQAHGMPRVVPIINFLDTYKDNAASRDRRRKLKNRLWTDLNAKIFLITKFIPKIGFKNGNGDYLLNEVRRLARLITVKIPRLTDWRIEHPYLLVDRIEDLTPSEKIQSDPKCDRIVSLYGWVRGASMPHAIASPGIHLIGLGDYVLKDVVSQADPCPIPKQLEQLKNEVQSSSNPNEVAKIKRRKYLSERDRRVYAPMSSYGGVLLDKDAMYIDLAGSHHLKNTHTLRKGSDLNQLGASHTALNAAQETLNLVEFGIDDQLRTDSSLKLFSNETVGMVKSCDDEATSSEGEESIMSLESKDSIVPLKSSIKIMTDAEMEVEDQLFGGCLKLAGAPDPIEQEQRKFIDNSSLHIHMKNALENMNFLIASNKKVNWGKLIYENDSQEPSHSGQSLFTRSSNLSTWQDDNALCYLLANQRTVLPTNNSESEFKHNYWTRDWSDQKVRNLIADCFTSGKWDEQEDADFLLKADLEAREAILKAQQEETRLDNLNSLAGRKGKSTKGEFVRIKFEDCQEDFMNDQQTDEEDEIDEEQDSSDDYNDPDEDLDLSTENDEDIGEDQVSCENSDEDDNQNDPNAEFEKKLLRPTKRQKLMEKRRKHREMFENLLDKRQGGKKMEGGEAASAEFDKMMSRHEIQLAKNREILESLPEEARINLEGHPPGTYVRLEIHDVPHEFITNFDSRKALVVGGLARCEESMGYLHARFLTHRWSHRILKSNDPITISVGWRRYQTVAVYSKEDHNLRKRFLKYSLQHQHCHMTFYGPHCSPKTGLIAFINSAWRPQEKDSQNFRVAGTGVILDSNESFNVMKKLKLVGEPKKIFAKTAFIHGMFNSSLEVSKVIGAKIQTASKIRGIIKASLTNNSCSPGDFRATFEAPIKKSDLVFLRSFVKVDLPKYYNPVLNLLCFDGVYTGDENMAPANAWRMMRTTAEMRLDTGGQKPENNLDSHYKVVKRLPFIPQELQIPIKLAAELPYAVKPKMNRSEYKKKMRSMNPEDPLLTNSDIPDEVIPLTVKMDLAESLNGTQASQLKVQQLATRREMLGRLLEIHADYKTRKKDMKIKRNAVFFKKKQEETEKLEKQRKQKRKQYFAKETKGSKRQKTH